jgi:Pyrimidine dimer DNA glycosylase
MQTFLPYVSFVESARCLDYERLGKQRTECLQLLDAISPGSKSKWRHHSCAKIWAGYDDALGYYMDCVIREWVSRGYRNNIPLYHDTIPASLRYPPIIGDRSFHDSHKSNLLRKDPIHYSVFGWNVPNNLEYVWRQSHD